MTKKKIIVDVDDTLSSFNELFIKIAKDEFGLTVPEAAEWISFTEHFSDMKTFIECVERCHDGDSINDTVPFEGVQDALQELVDLGYELHYFTDRKASAHDDTYNWLTKNGFPQPENLTCSKDKRSDILAMKDEVLTIFDDRPRTMVWALHTLGVDNVFALKTTYNRNLTDIEGVNLRDTWAELLIKFKELYHSDSIVRGPTTISVGERPEQVKILNK